jgi:multiple sugar transport system permease protein
MVATSPSAPVVQTPAHTPPFPVRLYLVLVWQAVVAVALLAGALQLVQVDTFFNLGTFAPRFIAVVAVGLAMALMASNVLLLMRRGEGRFIGILLNFAGLGLAVLAVGHFTGAYLGIDQLAAGLNRSAWLLLTFPLGYLLVYASRRLDETSDLSSLLFRIGLGIMGAGLIAILINGGYPQAVIENPGAALPTLINAGSIATALVAIAFLFAGSVLLRSGEFYGETVLQREAWQGWLFLLPNFINFLLFFAMPLLLSFYLSFTNYDVVSPAEFTGLDNYGRLLSLDIQLVPDGTAANTLLRPNHFEIIRADLGAQDLVIGARDPLFWQSLWTTIRYCFFLLILSIVPALGLAMLLNSKIPGMQFFRAVYFLPSIAAVVGVTLIWRWLYDPVIGFVNATISQLASTFGLADPRIQWLTDENVMLYSVVIIAAWQIIGFNTVILLAGLQGVQRDLIEAATVDGATAFTRFRRIILPLLAPTTFFVTVTTLINGLQAFSEMYTLYAFSTSNARLTVVYYLYQQGFRSFQMGYASATAWVLFAVIFIVTLVQFRISNSSRAYAD